MPIYIFECQDPECRARVEKLRSMDRMDDPATCGSCGGPCTRRVTACDHTFKKKWIPSSDGWVRGDM